MPRRVIKEEEAYYLWQLYRDLPLMTDNDLLTKEQAAELKPVLNDKIHEALGLK